MIRALLLFFAAFSFAKTAVASASPVDRTPYVKAVHAHLPALMTYALNLKTFDDLPREDQRTLRQIAEVIRTSPSPLVYSGDRSLFYLNPGEPERLMHTQSEVAAPIYVNTQMLNANPYIDYGLLSKLLLHEYGHQAGEISISVRDRLAQFFEDSIRPFERHTQLAEGTWLHYLSLPERLIEKELGAVEPNQPQPSFIVILERDGQYTDLTETLVTQLKPSSARMNSMWSEANRVLLQAVAQIAPAIFEAFKMGTGKLYEIAKAFVPNLEPPDEMMLDMNFAPKPLRIFEIQDVQWNATGDGQGRLTLKSVYTASVTDNRRLPIEINIGEKWKNKIPLPVVVYVTIPSSKEGPIVVDANLRADIDYSREAKLLSVLRSSGKLQAMKVLVVAPQQPKQVQLEIHFATGHLFLQPQSITPRQEGQYEVVFEPPHYLARWNDTITAESILINSETSHFLDHQVSLQEFVPDSSAKPPSRKNSVVEDTLGLWGFQNDQPVLQRQFQQQNPPIFMDHVHSDRLSLSPSNMAIEFQLEHEEKIREIRVHFTRNLIVTRQKEDEELRVSDLTIEGTVYRFAQGGYYVRSKELHEIVAIPATQIYQSETALGRPRIKAEFQMPFKTVDGPLEADQVLLPPMITPLWIEVVTDNLQTLNVRFDLATFDSGCEDALAK